MTQTLSRWELSIDRGPNWLLVKATCQGDDASAETSLAETLWTLMERHLTYRLVLELDDCESELSQQLISLDERARAHNGFVRLCGLPKRKRQQARRTRNNDVYELLPVYESRLDAVFGYHRPCQPR